jgi:hypothetical protein
MASFTDFDEPLHLCVSAECTKASIDKETMNDQGERSGWREAFFFAIMKAYQMGMQSRASLVAHRQGQDSHKYCIFGR